MNRFTGSHHVCRADLLDALLWRCRLDIFQKSPSPQEASAEGCCNRADRWLNQTWSDMASGGLGLTVDAFFETGSSSASPAGMPEVTNACPCAKSANETAPPQ